MEFRQLGVVFVLHVGIAVTIPSRQDWIVTQLRIFEERIYSIETEAGHTAVVPPCGDIEHGLFHGCIPPIQVRLLRIEEVVIPLPSFAVEFPCRTAESRKPIVGWAFRSLTIAPHIPVAIVRGAGRFRIKKPFVLVRGVVHHEIQDDANVPGFALTRHAIEIREGAVHRIDVLIVGNIVAKIYLWRREARSQPDSVHTELFQVVEFRADAFEIPDAVVIAVGIAARINLVKNSVLPPLVSLSVARRTLRACERERQTKSDSEHARQNKTSKHHDDLPIDSWSLDGLMSGGEMKRNFLPGVSF